MILQQMLKDPWTYISSGAILMVNWLATHLNPIMGFLAGLAGLITLVYGIVEKRKKAKFHEQEESRRAEEHALEMEIKRAELERLKK